MKQAIILAAGEGRRLRPFTVNKPKAMIHIAGKPIIRYILDSLAQKGIHDIIFIVGYHREQIFDYIGDGKQFGVNVKFITQDKQLGTAHALFQAENATDDEFLVLPGDKLIFPETLTQILSVKSPAVLVKLETSPSRYGVVSVRDGRLEEISEKPALPEGNLINTGIYSFEKKIFDYIGMNLDMPDVLNEMLRNGQSVAALETHQPWLDVVYPWDILSLNAVILQNTLSLQNGVIEAGVSLTGHISIGKGTKIHPNTCITGPVVIGEGCEIGPNVCIFPATSIANNVVIDPFSEIKNSVLSDDVHISSGSLIQDSVIDRGSFIGGHFCAFTEEAEVKIDQEIYNIKIGAMLGEGCHIGHGVVAHPGLIAGNFCQVKSLKVISGRLPDKSMVV